MCNSDYSKEAFNEEREKEYQTSMKSFFTNYEGTDEKERKVKCYVCTEEHFIKDCLKLREMSPQERVESIFKNRLWYRCLQPTNKSHYAKVCRNPLPCSICTEEHPTLLHEYHNKMSVSSVKGINNKSVISLCLVPVMLCHSSNLTFKFLCTLCWTSVVRAPS